MRKCCALAADLLLNLIGTDYVIPLNIRNSFVAQAGTVFLSADYSQLEMRLLAHLSKDAALIQFFNDGLDFFKLVARYRSMNPPSIVEVITIHSFQPHLEQGERRCR